MEEKLAENDKNQEKTVVVVVLGPEKLLWSYWIFVSHGQKPSDEEALRSGSLRERRFVLICQIL